MVFASILKTYLRKKSFVRRGGHNSNQFHNLVPRYSIVALRNMVVRNIVQGNIVYGKMIQANKVPRKMVPRKMIPGKMILGGNDIGKYEIRSIHPAYHW